MEKNKDFMYGIGRVMYNGLLVGYIEKGSWDFGGAKPSVEKVEAEQVLGSPVLVLPQSNGTVSPTFNMIQMNYKNMKQLLGGSLHYKADDLSHTTPIGWTAPSTAMVMSGYWQIDLVSGQSVLMPNATLLSNIGGKLTISEVSKIECQLEVAMPADGSQPYGVFDTDALPDEWTTDHRLPAAVESEEGEEEVEDGGV